jgi:uncharacterized repeat protein (TIGR03803 family)
MKRRVPSRWVLTYAAVAILAGCGVLRQAGGDMQPPIGAPRAMAQTSSSYSYKVLLAFGSAPRSHSRGRHPQTGLLDVNGTLYGTTGLGGGSGDGTVFSISTDGTEKVLHHFRGGSDGAHPNADLIDVNGTLYGTTESGGSSGCYPSDNGCGTVFSITTSGIEKVLHAFTGGCKSCPDGDFPSGSLIYLNGTLYGMTGGGGGLYKSLYNCCGTFYSVSLAGKEKVLFRFGKNDGLYPNGSPVAVGGLLYSTTYSGGTSGKGTVFSITTTGKEKVIYSFAGGSDGEYPFTGLTDANGTLYGTTSGPDPITYGSNPHCKGGCGTIFSFSVSGKEKVLHVFKGGSDGALPIADLANVNGVLYGTTEYGGGGNCQSEYGKGCGTVFQITTTGSESVLHRFSGTDDGAAPLADLIGVNGTLYGTTSRGGNNGCRGEGCGTVFELTP